MTTFYYNLQDFLSPLYYYYIWGIDWIRGPYKYYASCCNHERHELPGPIITLAAACGANNLDMVRKFCVPEVINDQNQDGATALFIACFYGHASCVEHILDTHGCNVNLATNNGLTPLHIAVIRGHIACVRLLLCKACDHVNEPSDIMSPVMIAVRFRHLECLKMMMDLAPDKLDINQPDDYGFTPIHRAVQTDFMEGVELLLDWDTRWSGCGTDATKLIDINRKSHCGLTPMHTAIRDGDVRYVSMMLDHFRERLDVNSVTHDGTYLVHDACDHPDCLAVLMEHGGSRIDVNVMNNYGKTPLCHACSGNNGASIDILLSKAGDRIDINRSNVATPLHIAICSGFLACTRTLLEYFRDSIDVNRDVPGYGTVLYVVCIANNDEVLNLLLTHAGDRIDVNQLTSIGISPLYVACANNNIECLRTLLSRVGDRIDPNRLSINGLSALHIACANGHPHCVSLLLSNHRTDPNILAGEGCQHSNMLVAKGFTPLELACGFDHLACVDVMLTDDRIDLSGPVLCLAYWMGRFKCAARLLQCDTVNVNSVDLHGYCALHLACMCGTENDVSILLNRAGARIHVSYLLGTE